MSLADVTFIQMCKDILENGTSTEGEKVRPKWPGIPVADSAQDGTEIGYG